MLSVPHYRWLPDSSSAGWSVAGDLSRFPRRDRRFLAESTSLWADQFTTPDFVTPSRPIAGFGRDIEPAPPPVPVQDPYLVTQMPSARVVQGDQPTVGNLKPAFEISGEGPPPLPARASQDFDRPKTSWKSRA